MGREVVLHVVGGERWWVSSELGNSTWRILSKKLGVGLRSKYKVFKVS